MIFYLHPFSEALRKYPTLTNINRVAENDYKVEGTNLTIKKGQMVIIPASAIHHDPEYYPDPKKFDPERFSPEETRKRNPYAFLGFGQGPRFCIGMRFGLLQSTVGLVNLLLNFKFERCPKSVVPIQFMKDTFVLAAEGGVFLKITKIDNDLDV